MTDTHEHDTIQREPGLYVTDAEVIRRMGLPKNLGYQVLRQFDADPDSTFPRKQELSANRRYWPAVAAWLKENSTKNQSSPDGKASAENPELIGHVYFLASKTHIKIGFSAAGVKKRIRSIRQNHYEELELLTIVSDVPMRMEKALHRKFAAHHVKGEWFHRVREIEEFCRDQHLGHWRKGLLP